MAQISDHTSSGTEPLYTEYLPVVERFLSSGEDRMLVCYGAPKAVQTRLRSAIDHMRAKDRVWVSTVGGNTYLMWR